jgi:hypothetical protein
MLGHESITTEIYLHLDRKFLTEVINTFHPRKNVIVYMKTIEYTRTKEKKRPIES